MDDFLENDPLRPLPPLPPRPEWLTPPPPPPAAPTTPGAPGVTPMMDFFQRRVEALERELALERERAQSAQGLLSQQDALRAEVEAHLKSITDQLKREKSERDSEESRSHARGRIETLEKRLDEMNATFTALLKDAVAGRPASEGAGPSGEALAAELAAFRAALKDTVDGVGRWRQELREFAAVVPRVAELSARLPQDEKVLSETLDRRIDDFSGRLLRLLEDWRRAQEAERARLEERVEALARERADLARLWDDQARSAREAQFKDRVAREAEVSRQVAELASRLEALAVDQQGAARGAGEARSALDRVIAILTETPKAKDEIIATLEAEKAELMSELRERHESFRTFSETRRGVEKSLGDGLVKAAGELDEERVRTRAAEARASEYLGRLESLTARVADLERGVGDRDERLRALAEERDELTRTLLAEIDRARRGHAERRDAEGASAERETDLVRRLDDASARLGASEASLAELRAQLAAVAAQSARHLQERDATIARFSEWDKERARLVETLRKKDEMISLLSATFQGALKKGA